jgi:hypothetical protein
VTSSFAWAQGLPEYVEECGDGIVARPLPVHGTDLSSGHLPVNAVGEQAQERRHVAGPNEAKNASSTSAGILAADGVGAAGFAIVFSSSHAVASRRWWITSVSAVRPLAKYAWV